MRTFAKILLTIAAIQYGFVPPVVDFTETHVFHSDWPPHARFHLVWLLTLGIAFASYVLVAVWYRSSRSGSTLRHASIVGCIVLTGFFVAAMFRAQYGGSLTDLAAPIEIAGIDGNVFSFTIAGIFQLVGTAIVWLWPENNRA